MKTTLTISLFLLLGFPKHEINKKINQSDINIQAIVKRIQSEKKDISTYILNSTKDAESIRLYSFSYRILPNELRKRRRSEKRIILFKRLPIKKGEKGVIFSGSEPIYSNYSITVSFKELIKLNIDNYSYTFSFDKNNNPIVNFVDDDSNIVFAGGNYYNNPIINDNRIKKSLTQYNFSKSKPKEHKIKFSKEEIEFLSKDNNFDKLRIALKESNLL